MNEAQKAVARGRELDAMTPTERLEWVEAASIPDQKAEAVATPLTKAQREYLGDRSPADLTSPGDLENFAYLGGEYFRDKEAPAAPPPFALDPALVNAVGLSPTARLAIAEAFALIEQGRTEVREGKHPSARRVQDAQMKTAMLYVSPYLQKAA